MTTTEALPERINVIKTISYTVPEIVTILVEEGVENPTISEVMERVEEWVKNDFSCGWGHDADLDGIIFQDENGDDL